MTLRLGPHLVLSALAIYATTAQADPPPDSEAGSARAYFELANASWADGGAPQNDPRTIALYQKACDGLYAEACFRLGDFYARGEGVSRDPAKARELYAAVCTPKAVEVCQQEPVRPRPQTGEPERYVKGCASGHNPAACYALARLHTEVSRFRDLPKAKQLYGVACEGNVAAACTREGFFYGEMDLPRSTRLFRKACEGGDAAGCHELCCHGSGAAPTSR